MNEIELLQGVFFNLLTVWLCLIVVMLLDDHVANEEEARQFDYILLIEPANLRLPERQPDSSIKTVDNSPVLTKKTTKGFRVKWVSKQEAELLSKKPSIYETVRDAKGNPIYITLISSEQS